MKAAKDILARIGAASQVFLGSNGGNAAILFGSAQDAGIQRTGAGILALLAGDKLQQNTVPTVGDDLANLTYIDNLLIGAIWEYAGVTAPAKTQFCYGQDLSRSTFATAFDRLNPSLGTLTVDNTTDVWTCTNHGLTVGDPVFFTTTGAAPTGSSANTVYYVATVPTASTFTLGTGRTIAADTGVITVTGAPLNVTTNGTGTHTLRRSPWGITDATTFKAPDYRGLGSIAPDNMGGTDAARSGASNVVGNVYGETTHALTSAEGPAHTHSLSAHTHTGPSHTHDMQSHTHTGPSHTHDMQSHTHAGPSHTHDLASHTHTGSGTTSFENSGANVAVGTGTYRAANHTHTYSFTTSGPSSNTSGAAGTGNTGGPSNNTTTAAGTGATGGPSNNTTTAAGTGATGAPSTDSTGAVVAGSNGTGHNNQSPVAMVNKVIYLGA